MEEEGLILGDTDGEKEGDFDGDKETLGLTDTDGLTELDGEPEGDKDTDGLMLGDMEGLVEAASHVIVSSKKFDRC